MMQQASQSWRFFAATGRLHQSSPMMCPLRYPSDNNPGSRLLASSVTETFMFTRNMASDRPELSTQIEPPSSAALNLQISIWLIQINRAKMPHCVNVHLH
jgi:hypothetical protein